MNLNTLTARLSVRRLVMAAVLLLTAISLRAQDAPLGLDTSKVIQNSPFTARLMMAVASKGKETSLTMAVNGQVSRDSSGRIRIDMDMPFGADGAMKMTELFDHVQHTVAVWSNESKVAMVHKIAAPGDEQKLGQEKTPAPPPGSDPPGTPEMLDGMKVFKTHQTMTVPAGAMGNTQESKMDVDVWYAPGIAMPVKMVAVNSPIGDFTFELADIKQSEPDAALFKVPADYVSHQLDDAK